MKRTLTRNMTLLLMLLAFPWQTRAAGPPRNREPVRWGVKDEEFMKDFWFKAPRPTITIPRVDRAPAIDGKADDPCWADASVIDFLATTRGFNSQPPLRFGIDGMLAASTVRVCYDDKCLYVHFECMERLMPMLKRNMAERDGGVWKDDCVEFFFDTNLDRLSNYHVIINAWPAVYDALDTGISRLGKVKEDKSWNMKGEKVASHLTDKSWSVEAAFPFDSLGGTPKAGQVWGANFCRQRRAASIEAIWTYGTWSGLTFGFFGAPDQLGDLIFGEAGVHVSVLPRSFLGKGSMTFEVIAPHRSMNLAAHVETLNGAGERRVSETVNVAVTKGKTAEVAVPYQVDTAGIHYATLVVNEGNKPVLVSRSGFTVPPVQPMLDAVAPKLRKLRGKSRDPDFLTSIDNYIARIDGLSAEVKESRAKLVAAPMDNAKRADWEKLYQRARSAVGNTTYVVWSKNPYLATGSSDFPARFEDITEVTVHAARNEYEVVALMVTNFSEDHLDLVVRDPRHGMRGLREVRAPTMTDSKIIVEENPKALDYDIVRGFNLPSEFGEPLPRLGSLRQLVVPPLSTRQILLVFHTKDLDPRHGGGGRLTVYPLNKSFAPKEVAVRVKVWPFEIPDRAELGVHFYDYSSTPVHCRDLVEHKINTFLCADFGSFRMENDRFVHDMKGAIKGTERKLKYGRKGWAYGLCLEFHTWATKSGKMKFMGPEYRAGWKETVRTFVDAHKALGLKEEDIYVCAWDEVKGRDVDVCVRLLKMLREVAPKLKVSLTVQCKPKDREKFVGLVNVWLPGGGYVWDTKFYGERRKAGDEVWTYLCSTPVRGQLPLAYFRHYGWRAERCRLDGIATFAWSYLVYDMNGEVIPPRGWEAFRQGVEDWQYFNRLRKEIARVRPKDLVAADAAEQVRQEVLNAMFKLGPRPNKDTKELAQLFEDGRIRIAEEIVKLLRIK